MGLDLRGEIIKNKGSAVQSGDFGARLENSYTWAVNGCLRCTQVTMPKPKQTKG